MPLWTWVAVVAAAAPTPADLDAVRARGVLRVLVERDEAAPLPRDGSPVAAERELVEEFAARTGLAVQLLPGELGALLPRLLAGEADVVAAGLTITPDRAKLAAFTRPVTVVDEVLVGRKGDAKLPAKLSELASRAVHVQEGSAHAETLLELARTTSPGLLVVTAPSSSEALAHDVSRGLRPLTVVDSDLLKSIQSYNEQLAPLMVVAEGRRVGWAVRPEAKNLKAALDAFLIEKALTAYADHRFTGDLDGIIQRGVLRVLTRNNGVSYFLYRGEQRGFDYELMKLFAQRLKVRLSVVVADTQEQLQSWLLEGRGDVIAASLTQTPERAAQLAFSKPYLTVDEVLVQRAQGPQVSSLADLAGRKVRVRVSSSYWGSLAEQSTGAILEPADENLETEELIDLVGKGQVDLTVADSHIFAAEAVWRGDVAKGPVLAKARSIGFGVRKENAKLKAALDAFVTRSFQSLEYNLAHRRYFQDRRTIAQTHKLDPSRTGQLCAYDGLFRKYAQRHGFDWRLLAAQAYQESRFDPNAKSWVGALGLFQVMPATGKELGVTRLADPEQGTAAGVRYLAQMVERVDPSLPLQQRVRFALAAYNAGMGHVLDARRLASDLKLDPDKWFGNVEKAMLLLQQPAYARKARHGYVRGQETVGYVSQIQARYDEYVGLLPEGN